MNSRDVRRLGSRAVLTTAVGALLAMGFANPALADTSSATAHAADASLLGATVIDTGTCNAANDGTAPGPGKTGPCSPAALVLPGQAVITAGVLVQDAIAKPNGTSAACAGAVGPGGTIQIGQSNQCTATTTPGGLTLLGTGLPLLPSLLSADAIYASCSASSAASPVATGTSTILNLRLAGGALIMVNPGVGTTATIPGVANLTFNQQSTVNGVLTVTALELTVLPGVTTAALPTSLQSLLGILPLPVAIASAGAHLVIGRVTCGANAITAAPPVVPIAGFPVAGGTLAVVGIGLWLIRRRRASNLASA